MNSFVNNYYTTTTVMTDRIFSRTCGGSGRGGASNALRRGSRDNISLSSGRCMSAGLRTVASRIVVKACVLHWRASWWFRWGPPSYHSCSCHLVARVIILKTAMKFILDRSKIKLQNDLTNLRSKRAPSNGFSNDESPWHRRSEA